MGGGGGGGGTQKTYIRYADYIEDEHKHVLYYYSKLWENLETQSPFRNYTDVEVDDAFFGAGYAISSFPSLYDMFGKFMAGLDIEVLFTQIFEDTVNSPIVNALVSAEAAMMDDDIVMNSLPRMQAGLRDINSVISSSFVIGKSIIEDARVKSLNRFSAELRYRLIPLVPGRWMGHLDWNKGVVGVYAELMKLYFSAKTDVDEINYAMKTKHLLWPFTILEYERAALGALQGATTQKSEVAGASKAARAISGALTGAAMGAMVGTYAGQAYAGAGATAATTASYGATGGTIGAGLGAILGVAAALTY